MLFFYAVAMLPLLIGIYLWYKNQEVIWWEWVIGSVLGFVMAGLFHVIAIQAQCRDHEILSGKIKFATHHPKWVSRHKVDDYITETYTDSNGGIHTRQVKVGFHYEYRNHPEHWTCELYFGTYAGTMTQEIEQGFFLQISDKFCGGKLTTIDPWKPGFHSGDPNDYRAENKTGFLYPVTCRKSFQNRIKASPSLYSYAPVPKDVKVFPYPSCRDTFASDRLIGTAKKTINLMEWDRMCSRLGPIKKVNLILIGFGDASSDIAHYQEAAWIGGKKNDLVMCYGGKDHLNPSWSYVFGWSDKSIVKINLQNILIRHAIDTDIIPAIENEVYRNYEIKEWGDFKYLQVEPPKWSYWVYLLVAGLAQSGFWWWARNNPFGKDGTRPSGRGPW